METGDALYTYGQAYSLPHGATVRDREGDKWTREGTSRGPALVRRTSWGTDVIDVGPEREPRQGAQIMPYSPFTLDSLPKPPAPPLPGEHWIPRDSVLITSVHVDALYRDRDGTACVAYSYRAVPGPLMRKADSIEAFTSLFDRREV